MAGAYGRVPRETEYKRERPIAEHENATQTPIEHKMEWEYGEDVPPARVIPLNAGWLVQNPEQNPSPYTGDNTPWRR